jgi:Ni2+-binding GTPase involved in maturation of urease and hydrogenase
MAGPRLRAGRAATVMDSNTPKAHFILIGGFLGAGKTSAIARLARHIMDQGLRVGVITNDQGSRLVDTQTLRAQGIATAEVTGGCFCCRFDALLAGTRHFGREAPHVYVAEAVGSCADLSQTVAAPLQRLHGDQFTVAPLSVWVDPILARGVFGLEAEGSFSPNVRYIYEKQIEEADLIVMNKSETLPAAELDELHGFLARRFPKPEIFSVSVRRNTNLGPWYNRLLFGQPRTHPPMDLDYDLYADGEARLAWFNGVASVSGSEAFDPDYLAVELAGEIQSRLGALRAKVAHLKLTLTSSESASDGLTSVHVVRNGLPPDFGLRHHRRIGCGQLNINLRAEVGPDRLAAMVWDAVGAMGPQVAGWQVRTESEECFAPGRPDPTHPRRSLA